MGPRSAGVPADELVTTDCYRGVCADLVGRGVALIARVAHDPSSHSHGHLERVRVNLLALSVSLGEHEVSQGATCGLRCVHAVAEANEIRGKPPFGPSGVVGPVEVDILASGEVGGWAEPIPGSRAEPLRARAPYASCDSASRASRDGELAAQLRLR